MLTLALLVAALWNPVIHWGQPAINLILLLDDSTSMERSFSNQIWRQITTQAAQLPQGSRFTLVRFGGNAAQEIKPVEVGDPDLRKLLEEPQPPRTLRIEQNQSNIAQALQHTLLKLNPSQPTRIILVTDGKETAGNIKQTLESSNKNLPPIFWAKPEKASTEGDTFVQSLQMPSHASPGQLIPITAKIESTSNATAELLLQINGEERLQKQITLSPDAPQLFQHQLALPQAGEYQIKLSIIAPDDPEPRNNHRSKTIQVSGLTSVLYIGDGNPSIVASLKGGGWQVESVDPARFSPARLADIDVIILDDIDSQALTDEAWRQIETRIQNQGTGLIVLGGSHSFGGGGYRNSILEQSLPVTAESREPLPPAAIIFLLDKSGSMDRTTDANELSRMAIARRAVLDSVGFLAKGDLVGLITFDIESQLRVPLDRYPNVATTFKHAFTFAANGGTRLAPAVSQAITLLEENQTAQRIIILVTDGFVEESSAFDAIAEHISAANIDLIALSIGGQTETGVLQRLTSINQGLLLPIREIAYLPRLMRSEILKRRSGMQKGLIQPLVKTALPFLMQEQIQWPTLDAYMVTKERDHAEVYLTSAQGDPLLTSHFYGAGRVTAISGGLGSWAEDWHQWDYWGRFLGELVEWNRSHHANPYLHIEHHIAQSNMVIQIDAAFNMMDWSSSPHLAIQILDPAGRTEKLQADLIAPGRYQTTFPAHLAGRYQITAQLGNQSARHSFIHRSLAEYAPSTQSVADMESAVQSGDLIPWHPEAIHASLEQEKNEHCLRPLLLALAFFIYLATLFLERDIHLSLRRHSHATKQQ